MGGTHNKPVCTLLHRGWRRRMVVAAATGSRDGRDLPAVLILARFLCGRGDVLVLWSPDNKVMPAAHGRRLAALMPRARYAEIPGAYVLSMLDDPEAVAREMGAFLTTAPAAKKPSQDQNSR